MLRDSQKINSPFIVDSIIKNQAYAYQTVHFFLNPDYTEEDEKDEFKVFLFIFFSVIMVQKTKWTVWYAYAWFLIIESIINGEFIFWESLSMTIIFKPSVRIWWLVM